MAAIKTKPGVRTTMRAGATAAARDFLDQYKSRTYYSKYGGFGFNPEKMAGAAAEEWLKKQVVSPAVLRPYVRALFELGYLHFAESATSFSQFVDEKELPRGKGWPYEDAFLKGRATAAEMFLNGQYDPDNATAVYDLRDELARQEAARYPTANQDLVDRIYSLGFGMVYGGIRGY